LDDLLSAFLSPLRPAVEECVNWSNGIRLKVNSYLCHELPPTGYITSVRSIVLDKDEVLVIRDPHNLHILPGGRIEPGESLLQALQRELLEETGCSVDKVEYLGFKHFHHLSLKPEGYLYPYPDFVQVIYASTVLRFSAAAKEVDGYELDATFYPIPSLTALPLSASEHIFLKRALGPEA
jgi:8-oxo-dGTP pyrophosphatase MutT (NUDIX family)